MGRRGGDGEELGDDLVITRGLAVAAAVLLLLSGCTGGGSEPEPSTGVASPAPRSALRKQAEPGIPRVVARNLSVPWGVAFLPYGDALVTERETGRVLRVTPKGKVTPLGKVAGVHPEGEGGLLGIAVSPGFRHDDTLYAYYTSDSDNRVVALRIGSNGRIAGDKQRKLVTGIPRGSIHNGGRLAFGPRGYLFISTGETGNGSHAQDRHDLAGKILRVTTAGKPAPGNPFGDAVYSYGHRNVQGMAWDPAGRMFATEFGQDRFDEINRIRPGNNYGWPRIEGFRDEESAPKRYRDPLLTWKPAEASPSGLAYAGGSLWAASLRGRRLWRVPVSRAGKLGRPRARYENRFGRLRAAVRTPDGAALWLTTSNKDGRGEPQRHDDKIIAVPLR